MRFKIGLGLTIVAALVALTGPAVMAGARGPCGFTSTEALKACRADAWDDFHETRGGCMNNNEREVRVECFNAAKAGVNEALEECEAQFEARLEVCEEIGNGIYDPAFDAEDFIDPNAKGAAGNPYLSLDAGHTSVVRVGDEELVIIHVTDAVKTIEDVPCRVVVDVALEVGSADDEDGDEKGVPGAVEYEALEVTDDWYALNVSGDVWYCGELSRNFEDGELVDLDGSFTAGKDGAKAGILIRANPIVGETYRQEFALGEAEDLAQVLALATSPPDGDDGDEKGDGFDCDDLCLQTRDFSPLEPEAQEHKFYLPDVGFVLAIGFEDGVEDEDREELVCTGDSLDVLADPACGIANLEELLDLLCELHPDAFCDDAEE